ncbi:pyridoxamine 5'-phosphate oxidase family protein [Candidatus Kaiserbacteria bacterium]|nr:pyridoxamine 5'-phosphate oxidase family protein [Candidatus Kaiserbacteria bacterium]
MTSLHLRWGHPEHADAKLNQSLEEILESNRLLSMASVRTVGATSTSWINTAYYSFSADLEFFILTPPDTQHCKNLEQNDSVALAIFDSRQDDPTAMKRGLQVFGRCLPCTGPFLAKGHELYAQRYPWLKATLQQPEDFDKNIIQSKLYVIIADEVKLFDERTFGPELWITLIRLLPSVSQSSMRPIAI